MASFDRSKLGALNALAGGGSPALEAYRQSQQAEQASRTTALQNALGGQDVAAAAAKAQAQYAPKVDTSGGLQNASNLLPAADSYLSRESAKLAADSYESQQRLTLQAEALRRKQDEISERDRLLMLQGAADIKAENQKNLLSGTPLAEVLGRKEALRQQLTAYDAAHGQVVGGDNNTLTPEQIAQRDAERNAIVQQMAATDAQYRDVASQFAGSLGLDANGLNEAYAREDFGGVRGLMDYLRPQTDQETRKVDVSNNARLRELAPGFGVDPLLAAGMFRDQDEKLTGVSNEQNVSDYVTNGPQDREQEKILNQFGALQTGLGVNQYASVKNTTGLNDEEIINAVQSPDWSAISEIAFDYVGEDRTKTSGVSGFKKDVSERLKNWVREDGTPYSDEEKSRMLNLAVAYYSGQIAKTKSESAEAE